MTGAFELSQYPLPTSAGRCVECVSAEFRALTPYRAKCVNCLRIHQVPYLDSSSFEALESGFSGFFRLCGTCGEILCWRGRWAHLNATQSPLHKDSAEPSAG